MLDFYLLSIVGFGLIATALGFRIARRVYRNAAMDAHCKKVMVRLDQDRAGNA